MAESSKKILEGKRAELEAKQAKAVEALYFKDEGAVDLQLALDIGLVTDETRARIDGVYGADGGRELFGKVLRKQAGGERPDAMAFTRAFEIVYGKFLLEQRDVAELEKPDGNLMAIFGKVLRFPVEEMDGQASIAGRQELAAAVKRLRQVAALGGAEAQVLALWRQNRIDVVAQADEIIRLSAELEDFENKKKRTNQLEPGENLEEIAIDVAEKDRSAEMTRADLAKFGRTAGLEALDEFEKISGAEASYRTGIQTIQEYLKGVRAVIAGYEPNSEVLAEIDNAVLEMNPFIDFVGLERAPWEKFLKEKLKPLIDKLGSRKFYRYLKKTARATAKAQNVKVDKARDEGTQQKLSALEQHLKFLAKNLDKLDAYKDKKAAFDAADMQHASLENDEQRYSSATFEAKMRLSDELWGFFLKVMDFRAGGVPDAVNTEIEKYSAAYNKTFGGKSMVDLSSQELLQFVKEIYQPFLGYMEKAFDVAINAKVAEMNQNRVKLADMEEKGEQMKSFDTGAMSVGGILQKAFPGLTLDADGMVKIRGFATNFKHAAVQLQEAQDYFSSVPAMEKLRDGMQALQTLSQRVDPEAMKGELKKVLGDAAGDLDLSSDIKTQRNIIDATITSIQNARSQRRTSTNTEQEKDYQKTLIAQGVKAGKLKDLLNIIDTYLNQAKEVYTELKKLTGHLEDVKDAEIGLQKQDGTAISTDEIKGIIAEFKAINIDRSDFNPEELISLYEKFDGFFEDTTKVAKLAKDTEKARKEIAASTNLTDAQAAKNIIGAIIAEQDPKLPLVDQKKLSAMILAGDVMKLQSAEDYRTLAEHGSAAFLDTVKQVGFMEKVIGFQYKVGEKVEKPFEGLKPEQFENWKEIENLFEARRLDYKGGFLLLAAFETFDRARGEKSAQVGDLEQKLKELLAVALGVEERMSEAGIVSIVNEAFEKQLEAALPLVQAYFTHVDKKRDVWETNRVRALNTEHKALRDLYRTGSINTEQYRQRLEELREKAESAGVLDQVGFAQSSIMKKFADGRAGEWLKENDIDAGQALNVFWNNPVSQWFRDRGFDLARASGNAAGRILGHGAAGTVKLSASLGLQTALMPFRFGKYALMTAGMPFIGFINLWRKQKWTPYSLKATVGRDVSRAIGYAGTTGKGIATGVAGTAKDVVAKDLIGAKGKKYKEKLKVEPDKAMERAKELWERGQATPLKIASEPWIDLEKYKAKVKELDTILAGEKEKKAA